MSEVHGYCWQAGLGSVSRWAQEVRWAHRQQGGLGPVLPGTQLGRMGAVAGPPPPPELQGKAQTLPPTARAWCSTEEPPQSRPNVGPPQGSLLGPVTVGFLCRAGSGRRDLGQMAAPVAAGARTITVVAWETPAMESPPSPTRFHLPRRPPLLSEEIMEPKMPSGRGVLAWATS